MYWSLLQLKVNERKKYGVCFNLFFSIVSIKNQLLSSRLWYTLDIFKFVNMRSWVEHSKSEGRLLNFIEITVSWS